MTAPVSAWRFVSWAVAGTAAYLVAVGIPTDMIHSPWFTRMLAPSVWSYVFWVLPAGLAGLLAASYVAPTRACSVGGRAGAGGVLSYLAVGCPICNKVVVAALGVSGSLSYFRPVQPVLGAASVALLGYAVWRRLGPIRTATATT